MVRYGVRSLVQKSHRYSSTLAQTVADDLSTPFYGTFEEERAKLPRGDTDR